MDSDHPQVKLAYSAPGKALLAGGYLVLDQAYSSYVVALSARMHALIQGSYGNSRPSSTSTLGKTNQLEFITVIINSPQFLDGNWKFEIPTSGLDAYQARCAPGFGRNPFLQSALTVVLSYIQPSENTNLEITIYSDDAYHSQEASTQPRGSAANPKTRFHRHSRPIQDVPKTGLGSSAALTTVVTAALIGYYRTISNDDSSASSLGSKKALDHTSREDLDIIHNLSQLAHCTAQGKIGSGFDVGSAVYGSIVYRRFPPSALLPVIDLGSNVGSSKDGSAPYIKEVHKLINAPHNDKSIWAPLQHDSCSMPPGIALLMGDVRGGSETPKLVSNVLKWRKDKPEEADELWANLNKANMSLVQTLAELRTLFEKDANKYSFLLDKYAGISKYDTKKPTSSSDDLILKLIKNISVVRKYLKQMTILSKVPIEPDSQTELIDRCMNELPGVLGGVVPGAGGYDAIALVVISKSIDEIKVISKKQSSHDINSHLPISWLELREQSRGLVEEKFNNPDYQIVA